MKLTYKPEIDGLRTIAVLAVIIYHAKIKIGSSFLLPGGFLGVDIFFVISGYLITSLIINEYTQTGRFSLINFYERRARRLLPILFVVMFAALPLAYNFLLPQQFVDFSKSQIASLLFISNFHWDHSLQEYGAEASLLKPFLHTWSLAVEEQYYIFMPFILIVIYRFYRDYAITILIGLLLLSLQFSEIMTGINHSFSFYMLPTRLWELLAGGLLANILYFHPKENNDALLNRSMPIIGLFLITHSILFTDFNSKHPGFETLTPVIGTILIIWFSTSKEIITRILSSHFFVKVGLISYSLYLWHYPVFAFGRVIKLNPTVYEKIGWVLITVALSVLFYFIVERPFRNKKVIPKKLFLVIIVLTTSALIAINYFIVKKNGLPARLPAIISNIETDVLRTRVCKNNFGCVFNKKGNEKLFLLGDSQMMPLERPLIKFAKENSLHFITLNTIGCQYILNLNRVNKITRKRSNICNIQLQQKRRALLLSSKKSTVIIGGRLPLFIEEDRYNNLEGGDEGDLVDVLQNSKSTLMTKKSRNKAIFKNYKSSILELARHGHKIILIYPTPEAGWNIPKQLQKRTAGIALGDISNYLAHNPLTTSFSNYRKRTRESFILLNSIKHPNIKRVYPHTLFCNTSIKNRCLTHDENNSFYKDSNHLTQTSANMLASLITNKLK